MSLSLAIVFSQFRARLSLDARFNPSLLVTSLIAAVIGTTRPGLAAETVSIEYGRFSRSISTTSLEHYAATGEAEDTLKGLVNRLSPEQQRGLQDALQARRSVDVVQLSQWLYTPMGEQMLFFAGSLVKTRALQNGQQALRGALITAASDGEISLLTVIRAFPTKMVRIDLQRAIAAYRDIIAEADNTLAVLDAVAQQSATATKLSSFDLTTLPDVTQSGPYATRQIPLTIEDPERNRTYPAEMFIPETLQASRFQRPVAVLSHGLGDTRTNFFDIGEHLASHGIVAVIPEHIGSNLAQKEAMLKGLSNETFKAREFIDRPLDITFLLDELERTNETHYWGKLDLDQVAVMGHSFGGYTALALAGATIDFDWLQRECVPENNPVLDAAELLQCRALELIPDDAVIETLSQTGVRDPRVQLVLTFAPVSQLFGQSGISQIQIPTMFMGGVFDIIAPAVPEQLSAFSWLTTPDKYLYLGEGSSHTPELTRLTDQVFDLGRDIEQGIEGALALNRNLIKGLCVAFVNVHLVSDGTYEPFLHPAYVEAVSQPPFNRHLVREIPDSLQELL
ncbi:conserved hypothetical protein [Synechococcus sp. PCC 7335]|nr:conserved hypothetical protein [Synechococcus sp. PCC 7335]